jgi:DNA-binding Lrp family transcriptional regulator
LPFAKYSQLTGPPAGGTSPTFVQVGVQTSVQTAARRRTPQLARKTAERDETGLDHCCTVTVQDDFRPVHLEDAMVQAYILVQTEVGRAADVARQIAEISGVMQAEDVTGPYDVIVRARAENVDELGKLVAAQIQAVEGITRTLTCPVVRI